MNENKIYSNRQHTRIKFSPLTYSCALKCITPQSPLTQSVNTLLVPIEYEPDRSITPSVVLPYIKTFDPDGIFNSGDANSYLSIDSVQWYVDNSLLPNSTWKEGIDYNIITDEPDIRGSIIIRKNIPAGEKHSLKFRGKLLDWRTDIIYEVESDELAISSTDKGEDVLDCTVNKQNIVYDPFYDTLLREEYLVGKGILSDVSTVAKNDPKTYKQEIIVNLVRGHTTLASIPSGMTSRIVSLGSSTEITANSVDHPELISAEFPKYTFDCRLIEKNDYEWQLLDSNGKIVSRTNFGIARKLTMPTSIKPMYNSDILPSMNIYNNKALVNLKDRVVDFPELLYLITWYTVARYFDGTVWKDGEKVLWQIGERISADISQIGIGKKASDSYFDVGFELEPMPACELLLGDDDTPLLDDDGTMMID